MTADNDRDMTDETAEAPPHNIDSIYGWMEEINAWCDRKGWNDDIKDKSFGDICSLFHAEISEAYEEHRTGHKNGEVYLGEEGKPEGIPIELADLVIRVLHFCAVWQIDLPQMIAEKMAYNETRSYRHGNKVK